MSYLIVTSRSPISHESVRGNEIVKENVGGVATALRRAMKQEGGIWICWGDGNLDRKHTDEEFEGYRIIRILLPYEERKGFYDDYANGTLWPLFHYFRERIKLTATGFEHYRRVNERFAETIARHVKPGMKIWIHDYQLALVPKMLRDRGIGNLIIFTWHIPWVASEFFSILPNARDLIEGIAASDMITFHTKLYSKNFRYSCRSILREDVGGKLFNFPLGVDCEYYGGRGRKSTKIELKKGRSLIFSVDRLDYTKGLVNKVMVIESLIRMHPEDAKRFSYVLAVTPSRASVAEYASMKKDLETAVGRINGMHSDLSWQPIIYMYRRVSDSQLINYYRSADILLITPLIDGLNLVSKEFVAATDHGVLILSQFAGAAADLRGALKVNPNDIDMVAESIHRAMTMPKKEAAYRLATMKGNVTAKDLNWWLAAVKGAAEDISSAKERAASSRRHRRR